MSDSAAAVLAPRQLGFGIKGGAEAAAHAARRYLQNLPNNFVLAKLDFKIAFNSVRRDTIIEAVAARFPELSQFVVACYGAPTSLFFGDSVLSSEEGVQQGDPLGPLLFCLAIKSLLDQVSSEFLIGYLDDITVGGDKDDVLEDVIRLREGAAAVGLELNHSKSELLGATPETAAFFEGAGLPFAEKGAEDAVLLGAPLCPEGVGKALRDKQQDLALMTGRLGFLPAHDSLFLMRGCLAIPRLLYILRTSPCYDSEELIFYDQSLKTALTSLLNVDLEEGRWSQASLSVLAWGVGGQG